MLVAASFSDPLMAGLARDRLRRFQLREEGRIRLVPSPAGLPATVVAGPVAGADLEAVRQVVFELGGQLIVTVPRHPA
ncbi:MAG: hypothetical protein ACRDGQ_10335 [Candidatus Limnocylindrales bacterium]